MPPSQALYYPWIDIRDEAWLRTSLLYWDTVRTIVPESIETPYSSETACALQEAGFLLPLRVHSSMEEIERLTGDALTYLTSSEGAELLVAGAERRRHHIHLEKLPNRLSRLARMHPEKLPHEIRHLLSRLSAPSSRGADWLEVDDSFALFYMTLLASRLAERVGAGLLTPIPTAERLAVAARLDAQLHALAPWDSTGPTGPGAGGESTKPSAPVGGCRGPWLRACSRNSPSSGSGSPLTRPSTACWTFGSATGTSWPPSERRSSG